VRRRSISFDSQAIVDATGDDVATLHQKPIVSHTKSHQDPHAYGLGEE
jgi:hypothetical protein